MLYPIDDRYNIIVSSGSPNGKPISVMLVNKDVKLMEKGIDIRYNDIDKYLD
jgi:hypothetical protein